MRSVLAFWEKCGVIAFRRSIAFANAWYWVFGLPILAGIVFYIWGDASAVLTQNPIVDTLLVTAGGFLVAFALRFICLLIEVPSTLYRETQETIRALNDRLSPKLSIEFDPNDSGCVHQTIAGVNVKLLFVRVLPVSESRTTNCRGYLSGIYKQVDGQWQKTSFDERLDLIWSMRGHANPMHIQKGVRQFLDVFYVSEAQNQMFPCTAEGIPNRAVGVLKPHGTYRLDIGVVGDDNTVATISLKVQRRGEWHQTSVEKIV